MHKEYHNNNAMFYGRLVSAFMPASGQLVTGFCGDYLGMFCD